MLASHIKVSKLGIGWFAALITPSGEGHNRVEILGRADSLGELVENCEINSTFDRNIRWLREIRKGKEW
jgi:hypothetical protein